MNTNELKRMEHEARLILKVADNEEWKQGDVARVLATLALEAAAELQAAPALLALLTEGIGIIDNADFATDLESIAALLDDRWPGYARRLSEKAQAIRAAIAEARGSDTPPRGHEA